jgi:hypothetical protein
MLKVMIMKINNLRDPVARKEVWMVLQSFISSLDDGISCKLLMVILKEMDSSIHGASLLDTIPRKFFSPLAKSDPGGKTGYQSYLKRVLESFGEQIYLQSSDIKAEEKFLGAYVETIDEYLSTGSISSFEQENLSFMSNPLRWTILGLNNEAKRHISSDISQLVSSLRFVSRAILKSEGYGSTKVSLPSIQEDVTQTIEELLRNVFQLFQSPGLGNLPLNEAVIKLSLGDVEKDVENYFYTLFAVTLGKFLARLEYTRALKILKKEALAIDNVFGKATDLYCKESYHCHLHMGYLMTSLTDVMEDYLSRHRYAFFKSMTELSKLLNRNNESSFHPVHLESFMLITGQYKSLMEDNFASLIEGKVSRQDLIDIEEHAGVIAVVAKEFRHGDSAIDVEFLRDLAARFRKLDEDIHVLSRVMKFLQLRKLCPVNYRQLESNLVRLKEDQKISLQSISSELSLFGLDLTIDEYTLKVLKTFAGESDIFAERFDQASALNSSAELPIIIETKTRIAITELKNLVCDEEIRISDFDFQLSDIIVEYQGIVPNTRRQRKMEK